MRKKYLPLSVVCLLLSFLLLPVVKAGNQSFSRTISAFKSPEPEHFEENKAESASKLIYDSLRLGKLGLNKQALLFAYQGYEKLLANGKFKEPDILTVCDFSQSSDKKRLYIIDIKNYKLLLNTYVAHGKNSGLEYAERFSNKVKSHQSSLGFYLTKNTYFGKHGLSLKLLGLESGFNDKAEQRAVVVHGADYIGSNRSGSAYMGRSFGCPAVPKKLAAKVINLIKNGTCLFIYHPSKTYLKGSKILNS